MAKSIRSKVKKRNRTEMRKSVGRPHENKLQSKCTAKLLDSVKMRKDPQVQPKGEGGIGVVVDILQCLYYLGSPQLIHYFSLETSSVF